MKRFALLAFVLSIGVAVYTSPASLSAAQKSAKTAGDKKSAVDTKQDKGIGPLKSVTLGPINEELVEKGKSQFEEKCMSCHQLDSRLVGPPLEYSTKDYSPEFIMNMILNSTVMESKDPVAKALLDKYHVPMIVPGVSKEQAREILEFLRSKAPK